MIWAFVFEAALIVTMAMFWKLRFFCASVWIINLRMFAISRWNPGGTQ